MRSATESGIQAHIKESIEARRKAPSLEVVETWLVWFDGLIAEESGEPSRAKLRRELQNWLDYSQKVMSK
jgi:hypothetical protein